MDIPVGVSTTLAITFVPIKGGVAEEEDAIDPLSLFLVLSFPLESLRYLTPPPLPASQHHCCSSSLANLHGMNETN